MTNSRPMNRYGGSVVDRTGWRYRSRRRGRVWRVDALTPFGWRLWPDWPGHTTNTAGGYKSLLRSADDLDDTSKWERVDCQSMSRNGASAIKSMGTITFGREVIVELGPELDKCGQFSVRLLVGRKVRWEGFFNDKSEEVAQMTKSETTLMRAVQAIASESYYRGQAGRNGMEEHEIEEALRNA